MTLALSSGTVSDQQIAASVSLSLTVTGTGFVVVVRDDDSGVTTSNPTASGLTFTRRGNFGSGGSHNITWWTAPYSGGYSGTVTVPTGDSSVHFVYGLAFGVNGSPAGFDANASIPDTDFATAAQITTNDANDFMFAFGRPSGGSGGSATNDGWTTIDNSLTGGFCAYQLSTSPGTYDFSMNPGINLDLGMFLDAFTPGAASPPDSPPDTTLLGASCM